MKKWVWGIFCAVWAVWGIASEESLILLADRTGLGKVQLWKAHDARFSAATADRAATVSFPAGKWSAILAEFPLNKGICGTVFLKAEVRWTGDFANVGHTAMELRFLDGSRRNIKQKESSGKSAFVRKKAGIQTLTWSAPVPEEARSMTVYFSSHGGGALEILSFSAELKGASLTENAVLGRALPGAVTGRGRAGKASAAFAEVECFRQVPFDLEDGFWSNRPTYAILPTSCNKSPRSEKDGEAGFKLAADADSLYVWFQAREDVLNFSDQVAYMRDSFEFFFMPTGKYRNPRAELRKEQYTVSRTPDGKTHSNTQAVSRLISGGWEALIRIPLRDENRRITPFHGLELTFNAAYQDADTVGQEHWMSYSPRDQKNDSWRNPALYLPLRFVSELDLPYVPLWLGNAQEYHVEPNYAGRINLLPALQSVRDLGFWGGYPEAELTVSGNHCQVRYRSDALRPVRVQLPVFRVLPGETLEFEFEGRSSTGNVAVPSWRFLSQCNWGGFPFRRVEGGGVLGTEWSRYRFRAVVPEKFRENMRSGRFLSEWGCFPGAEMQLRNFRLTHRTPVDFDASLSPVEFYSHWRLGEKKQLRLTTATAHSQRVDISVSVEPFWGGKAVFARSFSEKVPVGESSRLLDFPELPAGFFNVKVQLRDEKGAFLADRELYVSCFRRAERLNSHSGIFIHDLPELTPPRAIGPMAEAFAQLGEGVLYVANFCLFDSQNRYNPLEQHRELKEFKEKGLKLGSFLNKGNSYHAAHLGIQPDGANAFFKQSFDRIEPGLVDYWNFANEPNLWIDAREWASFYRGFFNAAHRFDVRSTVVLGNFNRIPVDYLQTTYAQLGRAFADGVIGVHLYGVDFNGNGFELLKEAREKYEKLYPGWKVWDMESGSVFHTFAYATEMVAKKLPIHLSAGVEQTLIYNDRDFFLPGADGTALVPVEAFKNRFYLDVEPLGRAVLADGAVHVYLFRRKDGTTAAVLWLTRPGKLEFTLPGSREAREFDQFGNPVARRNDGELRLQLQNRFVRYFEKMDPAPLLASAGFIGAFKPERQLPLLSGPSVVREAYVIPERVTRNFHHYAAPGAPVTLSLIYRNDGDKTVSIEPQALCPNGVKSEFSPAGPVTLAPGGKAVLQLVVTAEHTFEPAAIQVGGRLTDGRTLVPLAFAFEPAPVVKIDGLSRVLRVRNNSGRALSISTVPETVSYFFEPDQFHFDNVLPGEERALRFRIQPREKISMGLKPVRNGLENYTLRVKSEAGEFESVGNLWVFTPEKKQAVRFDQLRNRCEAGGLKMDWQLVADGENLILYARIFDATPIQTRTGGDIKSGGDVLIWAMGSGDEYREYGVACVGETKQTYLWRGKYGMETAVAASDVPVVLTRNSEYWDVALKVPRGTLRAGDGMSLLLIDSDGSRSRKLELGGGIEPRDPEAAGMFLER